MKSSILFWTLAVVFTIGSAVYQRLTGPTYPLRGSVTLSGVAISYTMERSYSSSVDAPVFIYVPDTSFSGTVRWKHLGTDEPWNSVPMNYVAQTLRADIPTQVPLTKLEYTVHLVKDDTYRATIPATGSIPIRFKGDVPLWVIVPHVVAMFLAMLLSTRAGLEAFAPEPTLRKLTLWTVASLFVGGFVFGPLMTWYAFGEWWTGWPVGTDVTDSKTLVAMVGWLGATFMFRFPKQAKWWVLLAALIMFGIFLIPHSV